MLPIRSSCRFLLSACLLYGEHITGAKLWHFYANRASVIQDHDRPSCAHTRIIICSLPYAKKICKSQHAGLIYRKAELRHPSPAPAQDSHIGFPLPDVRAFSDVRRFFFLRSKHGNCTLAAEPIRRLLLLFCAPRKKFEFLKNFFVQTP